MSELRDRIAVAMSGTQGHFGDVLDAVMAEVNHIEKERDATLELIRPHELERVQRHIHERRLRLAWLSARNRAARFRAERDAAQRDAEIFEGLHKADARRYARRIMEFGRRCQARLSAERDSRFRWAEDAAALQVKLDGPCGSCHPCTNWNASAVVLPEDAEELLTAALEDKQAGIVTMDDAGPEFDAQYAAIVALQLVRSWRPATVEATTGPTEDDHLRALRERMDSWSSIPNGRYRLHAVIDARDGHQRAVGIEHGVRVGGFFNLGPVLLEPVDAAGVSGTGTEASDAQ